MQVEDVEADALLGSGIPLNDNIAFPPGFGPSLGMAGKELPVVVGTVAAHQLQGPLGDQLPGMVAAGGNRHKLF